MKHEFITELTTDKLYFSKWIMFMSVGLVCGLLAYFAITIDQSTKMVLAIISGLSLGLGFIFLSERLTFKIVNKDLVIERKILGITKFTI